MKSLLILIVMSLMIIGCSKSVDESTLIEKDGLMYQSDSDKPYSGEVFDLYDTGENFYTGTFEQGKRVGDFVYYRKDGSIQEPLYYNDLVEKDGLTYSPTSDEPFSGEVVGLYRTGEKVLSGVFMSGNQVGDYTYFKKDGSIQEPLNYKDIIIKDGLIYPPNSDEPFSGEVVGLYGTGEREFSGTFKYGTQVEEYSFFNRDGNVKVPINEDIVLNEINGVFFTKDTNEPYSGPFFTMYKNGQIELSGTLIIGMINGETNGFYESGEKQSFGVMKNNKREGKWTNWNSKGVIQVEVDYQDGVENGSMKNWYDTGQLEFEGVVRNGKKDSSWTQWYENGNLEWRGTYKESLLHGKVTQWFSNGNIEHEIGYDNGLITFPYKIYNEDGSEKDSLELTSLSKIYGEYKDPDNMFFGYTGKVYHYWTEDKELGTGLIYEGKKSGVWFTFDSLSNISRKGTYLDNEIHGKWYYYDSNGTIETLGEWTEGERTGKWIFYHKNGKVKSEGNRVNDNYHGTWNFYDSSGTITTQGEWTEGERTGKWIFYYKNGKVKREGNRVNDDYHGTWNYYHENGQKSIEGNYKSDLHDGLYTGWFEDGQKSFEGNFKNGERDSIWSDWIGENRDKTQTDYRGDEEGRVTGFFESGEKYMEGFVKDGKQDGHWTFWYKNGNKWSDGYRKHSNRVGHYTKWYENGQKMMEGEYKDNEKVGEWKEWEEDGTSK